MKKRFVVPRGSGISIGLSVQSASDLANGRNQSELPFQSRSILPTEEPDDLYVFRKGGITFYDLGTRLRSVTPETFERLRRVERGEILETEPQDGYYNEYVELDLEKGKNINSFGITLSEIAAIESELLRDDPTGTSKANGSDRVVPHCAQLSFESEWLYVDAILYSASNSTRYALAQPDKRAYVSEVYNAPNRTTGAWKKTAADIAHERWNSLNLSAHAIGSEGTLKVSASGSHLRIESIAFFEALDTGNSALYKWTNDPSYASDDVGTFKLGKTARVFLRPRIHHTSFGYVLLFNNGHSGTPGQAQVLTRLPFYPLTGKLIRSTPVNINGGNRMIITRGFARGMSASIERSTILPVDRASEEASLLAIHGASSFIRHRGSNAYFGGAGFSGHNQPLIEGMLVGLIETNDKVYYGWSRQVVDTTARTAFIFGDPSVSFIAGVSLPVSYWQCPPFRIYTGSDDDQATITNPTDIYQS
jgi:hypothetical protein